MLMSRTDRARSNRSEIRHLLRALRDVAQKHGWSDSYRRAIEDRVITSHAYMEASRSGAAEDRLSALHERRQTAIAEEDRQRRWRRQALPVDHNPFSS